MASQVNLNKYVHSLPITGMKQYQSSINSLVNTGGGISKFIFRSQHNLGVNFKMIFQEKKLMTAIHMDIYAKYLV